MKKWTQFTLILLSLEIESGHCSTGWVGGFSIDNLVLSDDLCSMWQKEYQDSIRSVDGLVAAGLVGVDEAARIAPVIARYQFLLPKYYASLIDPQDSNCPIRLQAIPSSLEMKETDGESPDPLKDLENQPKSRVTHRFNGRVLLHLTPNCSMYCRFCFRKTLLNELRADLFNGNFVEAVSYITEHPEIEEVIFSGGDPFMTTDGVLKGAVGTVSKIPHVARIRFHTRVPVTFPSRVTDELVRALSLSAKPIVVVTHFNHPKELTAQSHEAVEKMKVAGFTLLNQTVLMKGINDSVSVLAELSRGLFSFGILPYYLHQLDAASGTSHFRVDPERGKEIYHVLKSELSGYLVPKYVQDLANMPYKDSV